jgi:hypothetical protein
MVQTYGTRTFHSPDYINVLLKFIAYSLRKNKLNYFVITSTRSSLYIHRYEREFEHFARDTAELDILASYENLTFVEETNLLQNDWYEMDNVYGKL